MPPVHPAIVHFPIALIIFSFLAEVLGYFRNSVGLRAAAFWSLVGGAGGTAVAVAAGYFDMWRANLGPTHDYVHLHLKFGWVLLAVAAGLTLWRWFIYTKPERRVGLGYLGAAVLVALLTLFQGWFGGEMVYSRGAGVAAAGKGTEPERAGDKRLDTVMEISGAGHEEHEQQDEQKH